MTGAIAILAAAPSEGSASDWLILLAPLVVVGALVALAIYVRGGPATAHGYAINATPRRRREVAPWLLTLLRPFVVYNHHRHAYVLRGIGHRLGPVLRPRTSPRRPKREELPEPRRTGRFERVEPSEEETVPEPPRERAAASVGAPPRAPVGARDRPQVTPPSPARPDPTARPQPRERPQPRDRPAAPNRQKKRDRPDSPNPSDQQRTPAPDESRRDSKPPAGKRSKKSSRKGGQKGQAANREGKPSGSPGPQSGGSKKSKAAKRGQ